MPVDVLIKVWLPEASYCGTKSISCFLQCGVLIEIVGRADEFPLYFLRYLAITDVGVTVPKAVLTSSLLSL